VGIGYGRDYAYVMEGELLVAEGTCLVSPSYSMRLQISLNSLVQDLPRLLWDYPNKCNCLYSLEDLRLP